MYGNRHMLTYEIDWDDIILYLLIYLCIHLFLLMRKKWNDPLISLHALMLFLHKLEVHVYHLFWTVDMIIWRHAEWLHRKWCIITITHIILRFPIKKRGMFQIKGSDRLCGRKDITQESWQYTDVFIFIQSRNNNVNYA